MAKTTKKTSAKKRTVDWGKLLAGKSTAKPQEKAAVRKSQEKSAVVATKKAPDKKPAPIGWREVMRKGKTQPAPISAPAPTSAPASTSSPTVAKKVKSKVKKKK